MKLKKEIIDWRAVRADQGLVMSSASRLLHTPDEDEDKDEEDLGRGGRVYEARRKVPKR